MDWVEFDVKVLLDGEMVSMHDNTVDRTTNGTGDITTMTYDEVSRLDASKGFTLGFVPVPRVEEILEVLASSPNYVRAEMHVHNVYDPLPLINLLKKYGVQDRCYVNTGRVELFEYIRNDLGDHETLLGLSRGAENDETAEICNRLDIVYLCVANKALNTDYVDHIHNYCSEKPIFIQCTPVQTEEDWQRMLDIGVDVIQTDFPEALDFFLEENGYPKE